MARSKGFQMTSKGPRALEARAATTTMIRPPEKRLPKRRSVSVMGLVTSSMRLIGVKPSGRLGVVLEIATDAPRAQRLDVHPHDDEEREGEGQVHVTRGGREDLARLAGVHRRGQEADPVDDQHEDEDGDAERDESLALVAQRGLDEVAHDVDDEDLPDQLELARHAVGDVLAQVPAHEEDDEQRQQRRHGDVGVEGQAEEG